MDGMLFTHLKHERQRSGLDALRTTLDRNGFDRQAIPAALEERRIQIVENDGIIVKVRRIGEEPVLTTLSTDLGDNAGQLTLSRFYDLVALLHSQGFTAVSDRQLFLNDDDRELAIYWKNIYRIILSCSGRRPLYKDSLVIRIEEKTGAHLIGSLPGLSYSDLYPQNNNPHQQIAIELNNNADGSSLDDLRSLQRQHFKLLMDLAPFIQYGELSRQTRATSDPKVRMQLDQIMEMTYKLLSRPEDHETFREFVEEIIGIEKHGKETFYHTLDFIHAAAILVNAELLKRRHEVHRVLDELRLYGETHETMEILKEIGKRYPNLRRIALDEITEAKYSQNSMLQAAVNMKIALEGLPSFDESASTDIDNIMQLMLRYGSFRKYLVYGCDDAERVRLEIELRGFNANAFVSNHLSFDVFAREEESLTSWTKNFDNLMKDLGGTRYNVLFVNRKPGATRESLDEELKSSTCKYSSQDLESSSGLNKVTAILHLCKLRQKQQQDLGKKPDEPLVELEERLENLRTQIEFGGRPSGGRIYSRAWHRTLEDFSREDLMLCCACLGGEKQDLTFKAIYNPTYLYLTHFIQGIASPLGFSILKAGTMKKERVLLAISPYEVNPAIRTALGETKTHLYVLDSMVKAALDTNAEYLLIDDIDLLVRDINGNAVRNTKEGVKRKGEPGYDEGEDVVVKYRNGEICAPRKFKKAIEKAQRKYTAITHEDIEFDPISGDESLVQKQFGNGSYHYSIQSVNLGYDPSLDYANLPQEKTKEIFDQGYATQKGVRTVFRINARQYAAERLEKDKIDLNQVQANTIHGEKAN